MTQIKWIDADKYLEDLHDPCNLCSIMLFCLRLQIKDEILSTNY